MELYGGLQIGTDPSLKPGEWYVVYGTRTGRIRGASFNQVWIDDIPSKTKLEECVENWAAGRYMRGFRFDQAWHRFKQDVAKYAKDGLEAVEIISKAKAKGFGGYPPPQSVSKKTYVKEHERNRRRPF